MSSEMKECEFCGELTRNKKFCSKKCSSLARRKRVIVECLFCGIGFEVRSCDI